MPILHFHYTVRENSGEIRRIKNINRFVAGRLSDEIIELEFYPPKWRSYVRSSEGKFLLSEKVRKKYYKLIINRIFWLSKWYSSLVVGLLCWRYKPEYIIGEYGTAARSMHLVKKFSSKTKTIIDVHGASPEEYEYVYKDNMSRAKYLHIEDTERYGVKKADYIICQSEEMKRHLITKYGADASKITSYKCGVDMNVFSLDSERRVLMRRQLGIGEKEIVFVYSGGMMKWQKIEETLILFRDFHADNPNSRLLMLTLDASTLAQIVEQLNLKEIEKAMIVKTVSMNEVPDYLNAADVAFLLRDNVIMNAVASPTKLGEYMACGLPIITNEVAKKWTTPEAIDFLVFAEKEENLNEAIISVIKKTNKKAIREYAGKYLSVEKDTKNISQLFGLK